MNCEESWVVVAFGDSITEAVQQPASKRWPEVLQRTLQSSFPDLAIAVHNAGVGGHTSREGLSRIHTDVLVHCPDVVLVQFGGNDATFEPLRHVGLDEYRRNLDAIRLRIKTATGAQVILLTFPPVVDLCHQYGRHEAYRPKGGADATIEDYRQATRDFAEARGLLLIDIDRAIRRNPEVYVLADGVHLTEAGNAVVAQAVVQVLKPLIARHLSR